MYITGGKLHITWNDDHPLRPDEYISRAAAIPAGYTIASLTLEFRGAFRIRSTQGLTSSGKKPLMKCSEWLDRPPKIFRHAQSKPILSVI